MKGMKDIDKLLKEAETGKTSSVLERITDEATPFWNGIEDMVKLGKKPRPYVVSRLLRDEYDIKISETAIRNHFRNMLEHAK